MLLALFPKYSKIPNREKNEKKGMFVEFEKPEMTLEMFENMARWASETYDKEAAIIINSEDRFHFERLYGPIPNLFGVEVVDDFSYPRRVMNVVPREQFDKNLLETIRGN